MSERLRLHKEPVLSRLVYDAARFGSIHFNKRKASLMTTRIESVASEVPANIAMAGTFSSENYRCRGHNDEILASYPDNRK